MAVASSIFAPQAERRDSSAPSASDVVGQFKAGFVNARGFPESVTEFIVRTDDPDVADVITGLFGGQPEDCGADKNPIEVRTDANSVGVIVAPGGIRSGYVLWGNRQLIQRCDGEHITWSKDDPQDVGTRCSCYGLSPDERDKRAKNGTGCKPDTSLLFSLVDAPNLGRFRLQSGSKILLRDIQAVEAKVNEAEGPTELVLGLEPVTTKAGKTFTKITVNVKKG